MREWKMLHGQNCRAVKCRSGNIGTVMQRVENAGVEFAGRYVFERSRVCVFNVELKSDRVFWNIGYK